MTEPASVQYARVMDQLLEQLKPEVREILLVGAIPHVIDLPVAQTLYGEKAETSLATIRAFRFINEVSEGQFEYHVLARRYLLEIWQQREGERFRQLSGRLAQEYRRRLEASPADSTSYAYEWLYHALASDPPNAINLVTNLFHELLESRELGLAELVARLVGEQRAWIGEQVTWLDYYQAAMAFSHYDPVDAAALERHVLEEPDTLHAVCCLRLLGRIAVRQQHWADGRKLLQDALNMGSRVGDRYHQALVYIDLGDLFQNLVESSGGILIEGRDFRNIFHGFLYFLTRGPLWLYHQLAQHINFLPELYGMNYQNWVAIYLLRLALRNYRSAKRSFEKIKNRRGQVEINSRIASLLMELSHIASAEALCKSALQDSLVESSPYYVARFQYVLGQAAGTRKHCAEASQLLSASLEVFERYGDWDAAGRTAFDLMELNEKCGLPQSAVDAGRRCLEAARHGQNILLQSEVAHRLGTIARREGLDGSARQSALEMRQSVERTEYIDRYPGPVRQAFSRLAMSLAYPCIFFFMVLLIVGSGISMQIIEGELRPTHSPILWQQIPDLLAGVLLPLLMVWAYYFAYAVFGQLIIWIMPFGRVDEAQPDLFLIDDAGIAHLSRQGKSESRLAWHEVETAVVDDRSLYRRPLTFSSHIVLQGAGEKIQMQASIFRYAELEREVEDRLSGYQPVRFIRGHLSLLRTPWLGAALILGLVIAALGVSGQLGNPWHGCYGAASTDPNFVCPPENWVYIQPLVQYGLFFASLIFSLVSLVRWKLADGRTKQARITHD